MENIASKRAQGGASMPVAKGSAIKTRMVINRGAKIVNVSSGGIVPKPITFKFANATNAEKGYTTASSAYLNAKLGGSLSNPDGVSYYNTLTALQEERGDSTMFISGLQFRCSNVEQFHQPVVYGEGSNGRFYSEELGEEINLADDGGNLRDDVLTVNFADDKMLAFNKTTGLTFKVLPETTLFVTLIFKAVEDRVMGIYI